MNVNTLLAVVAATIWLISCSSSPQIPVPKPRNVNPYQTERPTVTVTSPSAPEITPTTQSPALPPSEVAERSTPTTQGASKTGDQDGPTETNEPHTTAAPNTPPPLPPMGRPTLAARTPTLQSTTHENRGTLYVAVAPISSGLPAYDRDDWKHRTDTDRDCQDARQEVLITESLTAVQYLNGDKCRVTNGQWLAPYSNTIVAEPSDLDVDHMVPLENAHDSGAWEWSAERKERYANYLDDAEHLIAVTATANRFKGARGPEQWKPEDRT